MHTVGRFRQVVERLNAFLGRYSTQLAPACADFAGVVTGPALDVGCGPGALTVADVAMHGALTCIRPFPIFENVQCRPRLHAWFERVEAMKKSAA